MSSLNGARKKQALEALKRGNEVRLAGAQLKRDVAAGKITFKQAIKRKHAQPLQLRYLTCAMKGWGPKKTRKLLARMNLPATLATRRIRDITARQRDLILKGVEEPNYWKPRGQEKDLRYAYFDNE